MTQYERFQKEYLEAIELSDHDIDGAIEGMENLIVTESHILKRCHDANEKIYHEHNLCLLEADLMIMKETKRDKLEKLGNVREKAKNELDALKAKLKAINGLKEIKVTKIAIKGPLKNIAVASIISLVFVAVCFWLHEHGYGGGEVEAIEDPNFFDRIHTFLRSCGEWESNLLMSIGLDLKTLLPIEPDIIFYVIYPILPYISIMLIYASLKFLVSLVISCTQRLIKTKREKQEKKIKRKMRKLSQAAASA